MNEYRLYWFWDFFFSLEEEECCAEAQKVVIIVGQKIKNNTVPNDISGYSFSGSVGKYLVNE